MNEGAAEISAGSALIEIRKIITQEIINAYAGVSGDWNPLHVNAEYAKTTKFGGTIAHGHISVGYLCELLTRTFRGGFLKGGRLSEVKFVAPVRPGDELIVGGRVVAVTDKEIACEVWVKRDDGTVCVTGRAVIRK